MKMTKNCWVGFVLLAMGIVGAFSRFMPFEKIAERADSSWLQLVSAVLFVLSGFLFAPVVPSMKGFHFGHASESEKNATKRKRSGKGNWPFSSTAQLKIGSVEPQRSLDSTDRESHQKPVIADTEDTPLHKDDSPLPEKPTDKKEEFEKVDFRKVLANRNLTEETRSFLEDRLEGLVIDSPMNEDEILAWGLNVASTMDEFALLRAHLTADDLQVVEDVKHCICETLKDLNLDLIDKDTWDPSCQRAVSVVRNETAVATKILKKRSCGITFKGNVMKKQEVEVEMPFAR